MTSKLLLSILLFSLLAIVNCTKKNSLPSSPEMEILPKQLTSTGQDYKCYWAPNNEYIAFLSARNTYDSNACCIVSELWIMDRDGENQRSLILVNEIYNTTDIKSVSWASNSNDMLVELIGYLPESKSEIWQVNINGNKNRLSSTDEIAQQPSYSPDGTKIAFIIQNPNPLNYKLYVANTDLSDTLLIEKGFIGDYNWKSDSDGLIYSLFDDQNGSYDLWESSSDGSVKTRISDTPESEETFSCSNDDKYIAYSDWNALYYTPTNTFNPKYIIDNARLPQWIPNRNLILFLSEQSQDDMKFWTESWIVNLQGNIIKKIAEGEASWTSFSSTGDYYVYSVNGNIWLDYLSF